MPALALGSLVVVEGLWRAHRHRERLVSDPSRLLEPIPAWPGVGVACGVVGLVLILLLCYQLAAPFDTPPGSPLAERMAVVARAVAAVVCACAILAQVGRRWSVSLAAISLALLTLAVCTLATAVLPDQPRDLNHRYPLVFNAIVFALGLMMGFWGWLAQVWQQQRDEGRSGGTEPRAQASGKHQATTHDPAWTTAGRLVPVNRRFALVTGIVGLVVAGTMSLWPTLRTVSADDASLGRAVAGIAAHLLLLSASIQCARWTRRFAFHILSLLVLLSLVAFVAVRVRAYSG